MSYPTISNFTFLEMKGWPTKASTKLEILERAGIDGQSYRDLGKVGKPVQITTITALSNRSAMASTEESYKYIIGTQVSVTNAQGNNATNVMVLDVECVDIKSVSTSAGGPVSSPGALMYCVWTLQSNNT
jgi:hypothetical protein